jgi:hypothetical protein
MVITAIVAITVLFLGLLGLSAFLAHRLYTLSENALVLGRAKDATEYVSAQQMQATTKLAKPVPMQDNKTQEATKLYEMPDGTVRELEPVWVRE